MTAEPPVPFPTSPYCRVRAWVASIWADGPDDGIHPDWRPAAGEKVTLVPSISSQLLVYDAAGPNPIIVTVERVDCVVGDDGFLAKADGRPVYIAPTDDPLLSVTGWTWTATIKGKSIPFVAPTGGVVDLAMFIAAPATDNTKTWVERIPELVALIEAGSDPAAIGAAVEDYLADNPPGSGGMKVYTSWAEVDAETEPVVGVLTTDDWEPAGLTDAVTRDGAFFITTRVQMNYPGTPDAWARRRQELRMWDSVTGSVLKVRQTNVAGGPWSAWWDAGHGDLPNSLKAALAKAEDAIVALDAAAFNNPMAPYVVGYYNTNWRTRTGFAALPDTFVVARVFLGGIGWPTGIWTQTVDVPLPDGTSRTITRVSTNGTSYGAWTLQPLGFSGSYADLTGTPTIPAEPGDIGAAPATQPINARTAAYTLAASDAGKLVTLTLSAAGDLTVPSGVFTAGQRVDVLDLGAERVTFVAGAGMTLGGTPSLVSRAQYSAHSVVFLSSTEAVVVGDLGAA